MSGTKWLQKKEHFDWMQKCLICWKRCEQFIVWSVEDRNHISSINACRDAIEMCTQCLKFEAQRSPFFQQLCQVCAETCETFAIEIEKFESENDTISETVKSCITFAQACRKVGKE